MKRLAIAMLALAACVEGGGPPTRTGALSTDEILVATRFSTDPTYLRKGQFAMYTVRGTGDPTGYTTTLKVTDEDSAGMWIEQKVQAEPRPIVFKSRIDRKGKLLELWIGEAGSPKPAQVYPTKDGKEPPPPVAPGDVSVQVTRETVTVAQRTWDCTKLISTFKYGGGRETTLTDWCHAEAPFPILKDGKPVGGVVKRLYDRYTVELFSMGDNGREELKIPK
jgi:hypothetical protein